MSKNTSAPRNKVSGRFFKKERQQQAKSELDAAKNDEQVIKERAAELKPLQQSKAPQRQNLINEGKGLFSKMVTGFNKPQRSNVLAEFDERCVDKIATPFVNKIFTFAQNDNSINQEIEREDGETEKLSDKLAWFYKGYITMAMATKMIIANTTTAQSLIRDFSNINKVQFRLPLKLSQSIDQLGKTDLGNEDILRIKHQNMKAIQLIMKACATVFQHEIFKDGNVSGESATWKLWYDNGYHTQCYTLDQNGVDFIRDITRKFAGTIFNTNYKIKTGTTTERVARLPFVNFTDSNKVNDLIDWATQVGTQADWVLGDDTWARINGILIGSFVERSWLRARDKNLADIDKRFRNTPLATIKPGEVLTAAGFLCIEDVLPYSELIDAGIHITTLFNDKYGSIFDRVVQSRDISFKSTGSSAQIVFSEDSNVEKENELEKYYDFKNRYNPKAYKKIDHTEAGLGILFGYSHRIELKQENSISYDGQINNLRSEFFHSDFK